jgi:hypothetical protein
MARKRQSKVNPEVLTEEMRAEDILLGSLGYGEGARIVKVSGTTEGYAGVGVFTDGEEFEFASDSPPDDLQRWALSIIRGV